MTAPARLKTPRLYLRQWVVGDYAPFAAMNADAEVMEFFPQLLSREESDAMADRIRKLITRLGWGLWVVEEKGTGAFTGFVGLHELSPDLPFAPGVEVGWRLARAYWGMGYATEAATEALRYAFGTLQVTEVCSFASVINTRSRAVMGRLGMHDSGQNFDRPHIAARSPLREHVLYRLTAAEWAATPAP